MIVNAIELNGASKLSCPDGWRIFLSFYQGKRQQHNSAYRLLKLQHILTVAVVFNQEDVKSCLFVCLGFLSVQRDS